MVKLMIAGRRAAGTTRKGALDHLRDRHGKMVVCPPPGAGAMPLDYTQNHVIDGAYPASGPHALERDLVTEIWFDDIDHLRASTATPYYLENLRPDEPRFVDDETVARMLVRPRTLTKGAGAHFKAFLFVSLDSADVPVWDAALASAASAFQESPGIVAAVENIVLPPPTGEAPFVDVIFEGWFETAEAAAAVVARLDAVIASFGPGVACSTRSFGIVAEEHDRRRLQVRHGCAPRP